MTELFAQLRPFRAVSSRPWPGSAGVYISILHMFKGSWSGEIVLDDQRVNAISTMLQAGHELSKPKPLTSNAGFCSDGVKVQGIGFVLDKSEALEILRHHPDYDNRLVRYVVGDDINNHPDQLGDRWVINFWDMNEHAAKKYPELWSILVERVKPYRDTLTKQVHEPCFWKFWDRREDFFDRVRAKGKVLVCSKLSKYLNLTFGDPNVIYSEKVKVFDFSSFTAFAILQSSLHSVWALTWGSTTGETPAYVGSTCFDTFAFPENAIGKTGKLLSGFQIPSLEITGKALFQHRATVMQARRIGLTAIYNLFHNPTIRDEDVEKMRQLHTELDVSVADAYGWRDLELSRTFVERPRAPENDRWRFQVSERTAELLVKRLIDLNNHRSTPSKIDLLARAAR